MRHFLRPIFKPNRHRSRWPRREDTCGGTGQHSIFNMGASIFNMGGQHSSPLLSSIRAKVDRLTQNPGSIFGKGCIWLAMSRCFHFVYPEVRTRIFQNVKLLNPHLTRIATTTAATHCLLTWMTRVAAVGACLPSVMSPRQRCCFKACCSCSASRSQVQHPP